MFVRPFSFGSKVVVWHEGHNTEIVSISFLRSGDSTNSNGQDSGALPATGEEKLFLEVGDGMSKREQELCAVVAESSEIICPLATRTGSLDVI